MTCPMCHTGNEMAFSALFHGFVCLESECGFEMEMDVVEAPLILQPEEDLIFA